MTDVHALAGAYVLDAVDDVERAAFTRHLAECDACGTETDELRAAALRLADGAWSVPPPQLKARVLAQVAQTRQDGPRRRDADRSVSRWRRLSLVAAAIAVLGGAGGIAGVAVHNERTAAIQARAETERIRAILSAPDAVVRRQGMSGGGQLTVVTSADRDAGVVLVTGAPAIPTSQAYELWLIRDKTERAGLLPAGASDGTTVVDGLRGGTAIAMTQEVARGVSTPSRDPLVTVKLA